MNVQRIIACKDAERPAQLMTREEWYALSVPFGYLQRRQEERQRR